MKRLFASFTLLFLSRWLLAQEAAAETNLNFFSDLFVQIIVISAAVVMLVAILVLYRLLMAVIKVEQIKIYKEHGLDAYLEKTEEESKESIFSRLYKSWTGAVPVEHEADVMLDHGFDGIRELDNKLPPWWVAMFYITIAFAVVYLGYYHLSDYGPSSYEEYVAEVEQAEEEVEAYLAKQANLIDESNVTMLEDPAALEAGKTLYLAQCATCHGQLGEGGVGPNMTDNYWIHGGDIKDVFKTIKYGVPEKGMISWKSQIRPAEMHQVASYILTLVGTNPPNPKEPQGDLYEPSTEESTEGEGTAAEEPTT